jgi:predicted YcjX-like family ATPase
MSRGTPPAEVPTLTEVVQPLPAMVPDQAAIVEQVLAALHGGGEQSIERLLADAMAPALAGVAERVMHETRQSLARLVREQVTRAVAQALAQRVGS